MLTPRVNPHKRSGPIKKLPMKVLFFLEGRNWGQSPVIMYRFVEFLGFDVSQLSEARRRIS